MPSQKRQFGDAGEEAGVKFLKQKGYQILERNFLLRSGELDIIAARRSFLGKLKEIIFVEVKSIAGAGSALDFSFAARNVHFSKQQRLIRTAKTFLSQNKIPPEIPWRIDVLLVARDSLSGFIKIEHLENAVWG